MRQFLKYVVRILLFAAVLFILFRKIDFRNLEKSFSQASFVLVAAALFFYYLKHALMAGRWKMACIAHGKTIPLKTLASAQIEIAFLEIIFPLPDSEDALRIITMRARDYSLSESIAIALYDRMAGIAVLISLSPFSLLAFGSAVFKQYEVSNLTAFLAVLCGLLAALFHRSILRAIISLAEKYSGKNFAPLADLKSELSKRIPSFVLAQSISLALAYAACGTLAPWLLVKAFGADVSFLSLLAAIPLFYLSVILPLSWQGLGLYETTLVFILQLAGVEKEIALATGMAHFIFQIAVIFTGGVLHLFNPGKTNLEFSIAHLTSRLFKSRF